MAVARCMPLSVELVSVQGSFGWMGTYDKPRQQFGLRAEDLEEAC